MQYENGINAIARYFYEVGQLKLAKRTGWWHAGVPEPESIAEHSFRTAIIGYALAILEGADPNVTTTLCVFHDITESRIGDIPNIASAYIRHESEVAIATDQVAGMPTDIHNAILEIVRQYEQHQSLEAILAKDADRLECVMQAREYEHQGFKNTRPWMDSNIDKLVSASARELAKAALILPPDEWWKSFRPSTLTGEDRQSTGPTVPAQD